MIAALRWELAWASPLFLFAFFSFWFGNFSFKAEHTAFSFFAVIVVLVFFAQVLSYPFDGSVFQRVNHRRRWITVSAALYLSIGVLVTHEAYNGTLDERHGNRLNRAVIYYETARVSDAELSQKTSSWAGGNSSVELRAVKGASLRHQNLRYLSGFKMFAVNTQFDNSDLTGAYLEAAGLRGASFRNANLENATLRRALWQRH